jgi:hypothetical protein
MCEFNQPSRVSNRGQPTTNGGVQEFQSNPDSLHTSHPLNPPLLETTMTRRHTFAALAFFAVAAPFSAHADAPSGDINEIFAVDQRLPVTAPREDLSGYNPNVDQLLALKPGPATVTREQVRNELAAMPLERIGA